MHMRAWLVGLFLLLPVAGEGIAQEAILRLELELREYVASDIDPALYDRDIGISLEPDFKGSFNNGDTIYRIMPYARWASEDSERSHADVRELYINHASDRWEFLGGISRIFWGVTESNHLVDIINQTDNLEGTDGEQKLGQPMLRGGWTFDQSTLEGYILPGFREREFLAADSPLGLPFPVDNDPVYESGDGNEHIDYALRYSGYAGPVDYGLSWFQGTSREPDFIPATIPGQLRPFYPQIDQLGLDLQLTWEAWLWKLEAIHRDFTEDDFNAAVGGFEYTFFNAADGLFDLGLLLEYHYDSRDDPATVLFQNDLFAGARFGFTDTQSSELLAGYFQDQDDQSASFRVEGNRRVFDDARINLEAQFFTNSDPGNVSYSLRNSDFVLLSLEFYF